jgi:energy-coupling factor transporter transmembrane protein EcfT
MIPGAAFGPAGARGPLRGILHPVIRLGAAGLGVATCLAASPAVLVGTAAVLCILLAWTGLTLAAQIRSLRPWLPMAAFILLLHVLTTTAAAPVGTPSLAGAAAGGRALLRVACTVAWLALLNRTTSLDELVGAVRWYLRPAERLGFPGQDLGLMLAVAMGTAPVVLGEGRRIEAVVRLRRQAGGHAARPGRLKRWWDHQLDRARVVVPLAESLGRRAEALSLSLRSRRPAGPTAGQIHPPLAGLMFLLAWTAGLVWAVLHTGGTA